MKTLLLTIISVLALNSYSQQTYVPDDNFEAYLEANSMGNGIPNDDSVTTANISGVTFLGIPNLNISDLTGIEDFTALVDLPCGNNPLTTLDVTQNTALETLYCENNQLTALDVTQNTALTLLGCYDNQITSIDVTENTALINLWLENNQLTGLDVTQNTALTSLRCDSNLLTCLNVKNGNNSNMNLFSTGNPNLICIEVDNETWSITNWTNIDPASSFSTNCNNACSCIPTTSSITEVGLDSYTAPSGTIYTSGGVYTDTIPNAVGCDSIITITLSMNYTGLYELIITPKQLLKIVDLLGRETPYKPNTVLIYVYDDGTTERVFKMEE